MLLQECNHISLDEKIRNHLGWDELFLKKTWMETREKDDWWMMGELFRVENEIDEN
jgi:hypothetical protein